MPSKNKNSLSKLDDKVWQFFGHPSVKATSGDVGIEVELEGLLDPRDSLYWTMKDEGSLRGGMEFVLTNPVRMADLHLALDDLTKVLNRSKPQNSLRTSTHYHINVSDLTLRQVYHFLAAYYLLEPLLVRTQPEKRWGNLFCLMLENAETLANDLSYSLDSRKFFGYFTMDRHKYAALNLASIRRIGSVEFRFLDGITDPTLLQKWAKLFYKLVHSAKKIPPTQLLALYDELPAKDFIQVLIGPTGADMICGSMSRAEINKKLHTNYDAVFELSQSLDTKKFELPQDFWVEDLINEDKGSKYAFKTSWFETAPTGQELDDLLNQQINAAAQVLNQAQVPLPQAPTLNPTPGAPQPITGTNPAWVIYDDPDLPQEPPEDDDPTLYW